MGTDPALGAVGGADAGIARLCLFQDLQFLTTGQGFDDLEAVALAGTQSNDQQVTEIGRASCRERV